jgi:elongator complex protein 1
MRNLRNIRYNVWGNAVAVTSACWDPANDEALCTIGPTEEKATIELVRVKESPHV